MDATTLVMFGLLLDGGQVARVFISHATADIAYAEVMREWLRADGHDVFLDEDLHDGIRIGEEWKKRLYRELRHADAVVCVVTEAFLSSMWCTVEVGVADSLGCLLIPVRVAGSSPHPLMETRQYADYEVDPAKARVWLTAELRRVDRGAWREGDNPFPGLNPFTEELAPMFFGRHREMRQLADLLRRAAASDVGVVVVTGPSGCGKSSAGCGSATRAARRSALAGPAAHRSAR